MNTLIIIFLFLINACTLYFVFSTWYGQKKIEKMIPVWFDEDGNIQYDLEED